MLGPQEPGKAARRLLAALTEEFERLDAENAALVKEVEALRDDVVGIPVSPLRTASLNSEFHPALTPIQSVGRHVTIVPPAPRHLGPAPADTSVSVKEKEEMGHTGSSSGGVGERRFPRVRGRVNNDPAESARLSKFLKMNSDLMLMEERYENFYELSRAFHTLCSKHKITIGASEIIDMSLWQKGRRSGYSEGIETEEATFDESEEILFRKAIIELNKDLPVSRKKSPPQEIMLETYSILMSGNKAELKLESSGQGPELIEAVAKMRDILLKEDAIRKIAVATNVEVPDVYLPSTPHLTKTRMEKLVDLMDPFIGAVIVVNAIVIGVSTDWYKGHIIWDYCDFGFTLVFAMEAAIKIRAFGFAKHFCGHEMWWNIFDAIVVFVAITDVVFTFFGGFMKLGNFTLMRLLRFARLTKLVRVLKLRVFKELALLVNGCLAGFRTLFWAMVFLAFILFALGVMITHVVGSPDVTEYPNCPNTNRWSDSSYSDDIGSDCVVSAIQLDKYRKQMFGNVPRSMFTIFRCFTDGCVAPDGTPLVPAFYNTHGLYVVLIYMVCMLFVMFGLFNLIMAVFVENTIENAKHDDARRREARTHEHIRVARKLQEVIMMFCTGENEWQVDNSEVRSFSGGWFRSFFATAWSLRDNPFGASTNLSLKVTHDSFHKILQKPEVKQLLDDLDIGYSSRSALFEVLDANCNGVLEVHELVQGLLKMRGAAEKGDIIAALLAVRSLQRSMKAMELLALKQQGAIDSFLTSQEKLQVEVRRLSTAAFAGHLETMLEVPCPPQTRVPEGARGEFGEGLGLRQISV